MVPGWTRRGVLAAAAGGIALLAGCQAETNGGRSGDSWSFGRRDPARTGFNPQAEGPAVGREQWRVETDAPAATPVVVGDTVYVGGDAVFALAVADGTPRWERSLHFDTRSPPAVVDGTVYATSKFAYYAIDAATGRDQWFDNEGAVRHHSPVAVDGTLYLATTAVGDHEFSAQVVARSTSDGTVQWRADVGGGVLPPFAPAVDTGRVYVGRDAVYALDARSGDRRWRFDVPAITAYGDPAVVADRVYVAGTIPTPGPGPPGGVVLALDAETGEEHWRFETGLRPSPPAVTDESVFVTSDRVYALSVDDGTIRWRIDSNRYVTAAPAVTRTRVYLAGVAGTLQAVSAADGTTAWRLPTGASRLSAPAVTDRRVYVAGAGGRIMALGGAK